MVTRTADEARVDNIARESPSGEFSVRYGRNWRHSMRAGVSIKSCSAASLLEWRFLIKRLRTFFGWCKIRCGTEFF